MFEDYDIRDKHTVEVHCSNPDIRIFGVCLCYHFLKYLVARSLSRTTKPSELEVGQSRVLLNLDFVTLNHQPYQRFFPTIQYSSLE